MNRAGKGKIGGGRKPPVQREKDKGAWGAKAANQRLFIVTKLGCLLRRALFILNPKRKETAPRRAVSDQEEIQETAPVSCPVEEALNHCALVKYRFPSGFALQAEYARKRTKCRKAHPV